MKNIKDIKQLKLFDPWDHISPQKKKILDSSWPGLFQKIILPVLPALKLGSFYSDSRGRKSKELYAMLGALVLQQQFDLTDVDAVDQYIFDERWHYALDRHEKSDDTEYMCLKTFWSARDITTKNDFDVEIFESVAGKLAEVFNVDTGTQRLDSVHIKSNMRKMARVTICSKSIRNFLQNLKRHNKELLSVIAKELIDKYLPKKAFQCFAMVKPSEAKKTLAEVAKDLYTLIKQFENINSVSSMRTYKHLERILKEQFIVKESDGKEIIEAKKPKDVPSDSLQNPSDPDATYSGHKGQGYQVQLMETVCKDKEKKSETLNLITHVEVEQAHKSDAHALIPAVESTEKRGLKPKELTADEGYSSDENCECAKQHGVEVVTPVKGASKEGNINLSDFSMNSKGKVKLCPEGKKPVKVKRNKRFSAAFDSDVCGNCPNLSNCPVEKGKKYFYLRYTEKDLRIALRRQYEETDEFKDRYRWRSGVEAAFSELNRKTGIKKLRVRAYRAVRFAAMLKATGLNIFRAAAVRRKAGKRTAAAAATDNASLNQLVSFILSVKEQVKPIFYRFKEKLGLYFRRSVSWPVIQADSRF